EPEAAGPVEAHCLSGLGFEPLVELGAGEMDPGKVQARVEVRRVTGRVPRRAGRELAALQERDVGPAGAREVVEQARTHDTAADDGDSCGLGHGLSPVGASMPVSRTVRRLSVSDALTEVRRDPRDLALTEADGHAQLLEVLVEDLPAELDPVRREEGLHLLLPLRAHQGADAVEQAAEGARRVLPAHGLPVALHELPREATPPDAHQDR